MALVLPPTTVFRFFSTASKRLSARLFLESSHSMEIRNAIIVETIPHIAVIKEQHPETILYKFQNRCPLNHTPTLPFYIYIHILTFSKLLKHYILFNPYITHKYTDYKSIISVDKWIQTFFQ